VREKSSFKAHRRRIFTWISALVALGLSLTILSPGTAAPLDQRRIIGLPRVENVALQHFNRLGIVNPTQTTVEFLSPEGDLREIVNLNMGPESFGVVPGPDQPDNLARIEYNESVDGGNAIFGTGFWVSDTGAAAYQGFDWTNTAATKQQEYWNAIMDLRREPGGWNSAFALQNRSRQDSANIVINYYDPGGNMVCADQLYDIPANGSVVVYLPAVDCLVDGFVGSAIVTSDQIVAVSSVETTHTTYGISAAYRGVNLGEAETSLVAPALFNAHDLQTSALCVQNMGFIDTLAVVQYSDGQSASETISPFGFWCFDQAAEGHAPGWSGSATILSYAEPIAAVVRVTAYNGPTPVGLWMYTAVSSVQLTKQGTDQGLGFPLLLNAAGGWTSQVHMYNLGGSPAEITPRYVSTGPAPFVYCPQSFTIPAGGFLSLSQEDLPLAFSQSMGYFHSTEPVASAVSLTNSRPLGQADRHFGYGGAYAGQITDFPNTCSTIHTSYLPITLKETE